MIRRVWGTWILLLSILEGLTNKCLAPLASILLEILAQDVSSKIQKVMPSLILRTH